MEKEKCSNAVLYTMIKSMKEAFEKDSAAAKEQRDKIETHVRETNGSVAKAHKEIGKLNNKWAYLAGFCGCLLLLVLPIAVAVIKMYL